MIKEKTKITLEIMMDKDYSFMVFQDKFYDFLESNGFDEINCDHPKWNEICEIRNNIFDLMEQG
tara:strand:- start:375 stop:566 length:192 start_codon:yes stop_codon:yes gene_type:complete